MWLFLFISCLGSHAFGQSFEDVTLLNFPLGQAVIESGATWGDMDNDGDLDLIISGEVGLGNPTTTLYRNIEGILTEDPIISATLINVWKAGIAWGDYNNDGFIDVFIAGQTQAGLPTSRLYTNNGGASFTENTTASNTFTDVFGASAEWADYDNDGDLDILIIGESLAGESSKMYRNDGGIFAEDITISNLIEGVEFGDIAFADYDNDGHLDFVVQGLSTISNPGVEIVDPYTGVFHNNGQGGFETVTTGISFVQEGSLEWADYDNDGYLDLLISGIKKEDGAPGASDIITKVYHNNGGTGFTDINAPITDIRKGRATWGDYDNDGWPDVLVVGESDNETVAHIFHNDGGSFSFDAISSAVITPMDQGASAIWGDFDGDKKLDILAVGRTDNITFARELHLYRNIDPTPNQTPGPPQNLQAVQVFDEVHLSWDPPAGYTGTLANSLTYNIYIGTDNFEIDVKPPMSDLFESPKRIRRIVKLGNVTGGEDWPVRNLAGGMYYWNVQAVDADYEAGPWNTQETFVYVPPMPTFDDVTTTAFSGGFPGRIDGAADWGDYDNDGDLDLVVSGELSPFNFETAIYENINGVFVKDVASSTPLVNVTLSDVAWGDYDNDGDLDLIVAGQDASANAHANIYQNNGSGLLTLAPGATSGLDDVLAASVAWGDYNNDGFLDIVICGEIGNTPHTRIYQNNGDGTFAEDLLASNNISDVSFGDVAWGDFDNDQDLDLGIIGKTASGVFADVYENDNGVFTSINAPLIDVKEGSIDWGDYDNDGDLDILLTGETGSGAPESKIYKNNGAGGFFDSGLDIQELENGQGSWGDYNNDGFLDILLVGEEGNGDPTTRLYINQTGATFVEDFDNFGFVDGVELNATAIWGDYNNDGRLDIFMTGQGESGKIFKLYENIDDNPFTIQTVNAPTNLVAVQVGDKMQLSWDAPNGIPPALEEGVSYNIYISETPPGPTGNANPMSPMAEVGGGYRKVVRLGNTSLNQGWTIENLGGGEYYWSVQAIFSDFRSSPFANQQIFSFNAPDFVDVSDMQLPAISVAAGLDESDVSWADYDNDGDLDILVTGNSASGFSTQFFKNENGNFLIDILNGGLIPDVWKGAAAWGDYDNDGWVDLMLTGESSAGALSKLYRNNGAGVFEESSEIFTFVQNGDVAWEDYDNDGDLDLILAGESGTGPILKLYRNEGDGTFLDTGLAFTGVQASSIAWGDYNNDGWKDLLAAGNTGTGQSAKLYQNNSDGTFTEINTGLDGVDNGSVAWGDYNRDGFQDILLSGNTGTGIITGVYFNNVGSGTFNGIGAGLTPLKNGQAIWGDYNNDDYLDILSIGENAAGIPVVELFENNNGFAFQKDEINSSAFIEADQGSSIAWGDFNNDGKLDVLLAGRSDNSPLTRVLKIYENQEPTPNTVPGIANNLTSTQVDNSVVLGWDPPMGYTANEAASLTYEVCIGLSIGGVEVASPMSNLTTGFRKIVRAGRTHRTTFTIEDLPIGSYIWSVQVIDAAYEGSLFAPKEAFNFVPPGAAFINTTTNNFPLSPEGLEDATLSWGDYDNDNDLDLLAIGLNSAGQSTTSLYQNTAGGFEKNLPASVGFAQLSDGDAVWGDLNHDGLLDLVMVGASSGGGATSILYINNGGGNFSPQAFTAIGVQHGALALGDYDNDGDLDIFMSGLSAGGLVSLLFDNDGLGNFVESGIIFQALADGDAAWGDYNNDNFLDLLLIGDNGAGPVTKLYQNTGNGGFVDQAIGLIPVSHGSVDWGDYDNDGDLDILLTGASSIEPVSKVYRNDGVLGFTDDPGATLAGVKEGDAAWGDYDDDGYLDVILVGTPVDETSRLAKVYHNNNGTFFGEDPLNSSIITAADKGSGLAWADFDNDGKLDLALAGRAGLVAADNTLLFFQNINANPNTTPGNPEGLTATQDGEDMILSWTPPPTYPAALKDGLSYNLYIGTSFGGIDIAAPNANIGDGYYQIVKEGGIKGTSWRVKGLEIGTYFWNVQAIDADYEGSGFAQPSVSFTFIPPGASFIDVTNDTTFNVSLPAGLVNAAIAWGDYDNDGDLDLLAAGEMTNGTPTTDIYRNDGGTFVQDPLASTPLVGISNGDVAWGDYDNDGFIDILLAGETSIGRTSVVYRNTGGGTFDDIGATLSDVSLASVDWGDYDNDGDLDVLISGEVVTGSMPTTKVYQNDNGTFVDAFISITGVKSGKAIWGDFDSDHRLDILITGQSTSGATSKVYQNQGSGIFVDIGAPITGLVRSAAAWGDYNNDGFLDIAISGEDPSLPNSADAITKVYRYNNLTDNFIDANITVTGLKDGDIAWGDFNNDGYLDLVLSGASGASANSRKTLVYRNQNGTILTEDNVNSDILSDADEGSQLSWGDFDEDGKLDLAIAGKVGNANAARALKLFRNIDANINEVPDAPQTLDAIQNGDEVVLSWTPPPGYSAAIEAGLSYNIYLSRVPANIDIKSPMASLIDGERKVVQIGNTAHSTSWTLSGLTAGNYYWSVQAIDQDFEGSPFAPEQTFTYIPPGAAFLDVTSTTFVDLPAGLNDADLAWGDYDNDDDLDLLVAGKLSDGLAQTILYQNNNGVYTQNATASATLENVFEASVSWTDYNNDGWLDIFITGNNGSTNVSALYANTNGTFTEALVGIEGVAEGDAQWGDYDNDGDLDLLIIGQSNNAGPISKIYRNENGNSLTDINATLTPVYDGSIGWGDYDADGDLDILLTGETAGNGPLSAVYRNDEGIFTDIGANLLDVSSSSASWTDFNNDGHLDILLVGDNSPSIFGFSPVASVYYYQATTQNFQAINALLTPVRNGTAVCGDYNDDGWIDIVLNGKEGAGVTQRTTRVYTNNGGSGFAEDLVNSAILTDLDEGSTIAWGDYNKDGKLDLVMSGRSSNSPLSNSLILYQNIEPSPNLTAIAPNSLFAQQIGNDMIFSWGAPSNYNTNIVQGLSYNLYLGTSVEANEEVSPLSNISNGFRRVVKIGGIASTSITIKNLSAGDYRWSVQAIEADYEGSPFAAQQQFAFQTPDFIDVTTPNFADLPSGLKNSDMAWGDYDKDGDLDVIVIGEVNGGAFTRLYTQQAGVFSNSNISLPNVKNGSVEWGDYNNDGYLDILMTGETSINFVTKVLENNQGIGFNDILFGFDGVSSGDAQWIDFDQDGLDDIVVSGLSISGRTTQLIKNFGLGAFVPVASSIPGYSDASMDIGDYDKDGDLDFIIAGETGAGASTDIYTNDGSGGFVDAGINITGMVRGSVEWGDFDNDAFTDILIAGASSLGPALQVYRNDQNGGFVQVSTRIFGIQDGVAAWGDYDDDGLIDILVTGNTGGNDEDRLTSLYKNIGGDFEEDELNAPILTDANQGSSAAWADFDQDGKLDIIIGGSTVDNNAGSLYLYKNNEGSQNITPTVPTELSSDQQGQKIILTWDAPMNFPPERLGGLSYNVYVGNVSQQGNRRPPLADETNGFRRVVSLGNTTQAFETSITDLPPGNYFWSVQAIDGDFEGSPFATEAQFEVKSPTFVDVTSTTFPLGPPQGLSLSDADWGDFDADGDLDLIALGQTASSNYYTGLFINENGDLVENQGLLGAFGDFRDGSVDWGDYDNDGDLDLLVTGESIVGRLSSIFRNDNGTLNQISAPLVAVSNSDALWMDYDNDGLLDIFLIGETNTGPVSRVYKNQVINEENTFVLSGISLIDVQNGAIAPSDFNKDGYPDIIISGEGNTGAVTQLYQNNGEGGFNPVSSGIIPVSESALDWGDFNNDGWPDILIAGENNANIITKVYLNNGDNSFTDILADLKGVKGGSAAWGDFNDDGFQDVLLSGQSGNGGEERLTALYKNIDGTGFELDEINSPILTNTDLGSKAVWGDYNNDQKLDILLLGRSNTSPIDRVFTLFQNTDPEPNRSVPAPVLQQATQIGDKVRLVWTPPVGQDADLINGVSYNVVVSRSPNGFEQVSPMADLGDGYRRIVQQGNAHQALRWDLSGLDAGTYYWSVQSIDVDFEGSDFAPVDSFLFIPPGAVFVNETGGAFPNGIQGGTQTSVAWGDYDSDKDLDLLVSGKSGANNFFTLLYKNNNGVFTLDQTASDQIQDVGNGSADWGDYDNDGDLDLIIMGENQGGSITKIYRNEGNSQFIDIGFAIDQVTDGTVKWGDFSNDGRLDFVITGLNDRGAPLSLLFENDRVGSFNIVLNASLREVASSSASWSDYDLDGDLDLLLLGQSSGGPLTTLYRNDGDGIFVEVQDVDLLALYNGSVTWGDYDNDGFPDILMTGYTGIKAETRIYRNTGTGTFLAVEADIKDVFDGQAAFGDYDDDGWIDIILSGREGLNATSRTTSLYHNNEGTFELDDINSAILADMNSGSSVAWGDYNGDKKLDVLLIGQTVGNANGILELYRNIDINPNNVPLPPEDLSISQNGDEITFSWTPPTGYDANTVKGLSYNIYVGSTSRQVDRTSPMADLLSGTRQIVYTGNSGQNTSWTLKGLSSGNYYWSVQAIEGDYEGSKFAEPEQNFAYIPPDFSVPPTTNIFPFGGPQGVVDGDIAWADYSGDGLLDFVSIGQTGIDDFSVEAFSAIGGGSYIPDLPLVANMVPVRKGDIEWGDIDNDNRPDLLLTGESEDGPITKVYVKSPIAEFMTDLGLSVLTPVMESSAAWGDYDNDGLQDVVVAGMTQDGDLITRLYRNTGENDFEVVNANFVGVYRGDVEWGDFDGDRDLDLFVTGSSQAGPVSKLYENDGNGRFIEFNIVLRNLGRSSIAWGDYDNDGDLDFAIAGSDGTQAQTFVYRNQGAQGFREINDAFTGVEDGSLSWGDYDDDGDLDLLITGTNASGEPFTAIYSNFGGVNFFINPINSAFLEDVNQGSRVEWADFNDDKKLDFALLGADANGNSLLQLFQNDNANQNLIASAPRNLSATQTGAVIEFSWQPPAGYDASLTPGLSYNLYVGSTPGASNLQTPLASVPLGKRSIVKFGGITDTSWVVKNLPDGEYYWSVQAIEADYEGSPFAEESIVNFFPPTFVDVTSEYPGLPFGLNDVNMEWGDFDNDGDLDILMIGDIGVGSRLTRVYRQTESGFEFVQGLGLIALDEGDVAWGDFDNDRLLDFVVTGMSSSGPYTRVYRNTGVQNAPFVLFSSNEEVANVSNSSVDWGDYDNDGDLDLLITGLSENGPVSRIYQNTDGNFFDIQAGLTGISSGEAKWGDFNNDHLLDLVISGDNNGTRVTQIYQNEGENFFTFIDAGLLAVRESSVDWGDYDNDGFIDLVVAGDADTGPNTTVYKNLGGASFFPILPLHGIRDGSVQWGDYNNDGFRDIILTGKDGANVLDRTTRLYKGDGVSFTPDVVNSDFVVDVNEGSKAVWGDFDRDLKLDFIIAGQAENAPNIYTLRLYRNIGNIPTEIPTPPKNLSFNVESDKVALEWSQPAGYDLAAIEGLTYNIYIEKAPQGDQDYQLSPMSLYENGIRKIVSSGNAGHQLSDTIFGLEGGEYYFGVQTIEGNFNSSEFERFGPFTFIEPTFSDETSASLPTLPFRGLDNASIDWGDYDNDGDLDIITTGEGDGEFHTHLLVNENGVFQPSPIDFLDVKDGTARWGDYNKDGFLDIFLSGSTSAGPVMTIYRNVGGNSFTNVAGFLEGAAESYADWGDFDNDGDPDLLVIGKFGTQSTNAITRIYQNNTEGDIPDFDLFGATLVNLSNGMVDWGDYDNDGDLDILLTGHTGAIPVTDIYRNDPPANENDPIVVFTRIGQQLGLTGVSGGSAQWGDFNNDALLDFVVSGTDNGGQPVVEVYRNEGNNNFTALNAPITDVAEGSAKWGDYNDDGYLDLAIVGQAGANDDSRLARIYQNLSGDSFTHDELASVFLQRVENSAICAWADYDNDQKLDLIIAGRSREGRKVFRLYHNNEETPNRTPVPPINLDASISFSATGAKFQWEPPTDYPDSLVGGLSYNIYVWKEENNKYSVEAAADTATGYRRLVHTGNVGHANQWTIELREEGNYLWSVQSIDTDFEGSEFADERPFFYKPEGFVNITPTLFPGGVEGVNSSTLIWGDYDNDGDLDILAAGEVTMDTFSTAIYRNDFNPVTRLTTFEKDEVASDPLIDVRYASLDWGDYDWDGDLDILLCGQDTAQNRISRIYRNIPASGGGRTFVWDTLASQNLVQVWGASSAWGDYDNDGDIDIVITGNSASGPVTKLYKSSQGKEFVEDQSFTGVEFGSIDWGDFDQDNYLDLVITGLNAGNSPFSQVLHNDGDGGFIDFDLSAPILDVKESSVAWGDCNNDGYLDLIITGDRGGGGSSSFITEIYKYDPLGGKFDVLPEPDPGNPVIKSVTQGSVDWGDFDGDGDLDIIITGRVNDTTRISKVYINNFNPNEEVQFPFTEDINTSGKLEDVDLGASVWGDYDADGKLDILLSGRTAETPVQRTFAVYRNIDIDINTNKPGVPENLQVDNSQRDRLIFTWEPPSAYPDSLKAGLTYNLMVLAYDSARFQMSPMADTISGYRRVVNFGNAGHNTSYELRGLPTGTYCWAVQTVDPDFQGSDFAPYTSCFEYESPTPQIIDSLFAKLYIKDSDTIESWIRVRDPSIVERVDLWYRGIAQTDPIFHKVTAINVADTFKFKFNNQFVIENPSAINDEGDEIGLEYYFQVVGKFNFNAQTPNVHMYIHYPDGIDITRSNASYIMKYGTTEDAYGIMAVPLVLEDSSIANVVEDDLGEYDIYEWRFGHYKSGGLQNGENIEYKKGLDNISTGKGYWLIMASEEVTNDSINTRAGTTVKVKRDKPYVISLEPGWNQIGNPYHFDVVWEDIPQIVDSNLQYCTYDRQFIIDPDQLRKFEGGFVFAPQQLDLEIPAVKNPEVRRKAPYRGPQSTTIDAINWKVDLELQSGEHLYTMGAIGMNLVADSSFDQHDIMRPPRPAHYLDMTSWHDEYELWPMFSGDIVAKADDHIWEFEVESNLGYEYIQLAWDKEGIGGNEKQLYLYHVELERYFNMQAFESYRYIDDGVAQHFRIFYGDENFIEENLIPAEITLGRAYPNPFSDDVNIPFTLPDKFGTYKPHDYRVVLKVYNTIGQEIQTLFEGNLKPDFYEMQWNGRNKSGIKVTEGIYIYQLIVDTPTGSYSKSGRVLKR